MAFFTSAIDTLKVLVITLGAGLGVWDVINLLEGYGNDNPGAIDRQYHTIPNKRKQRTKDKHCGNVHNRLWNHGKLYSQHMEKLKGSFPMCCE